MVNRVERQETSMEHMVSSSPKIQVKDAIEKVGHQKTASRTHDKKMPIAGAENMVESMNEFLTSADSRLKFVLHDELETYYVTIIDKETDEIIREIPSETLMNIRAAMKEFVGLLVDQKI